VNQDKSIAEFSAAIKEKALEIGFAGCGFSRAEALPEDAMRLLTWLQDGHHARMGYMANHFEKRTDPTILVEGARTIVSLLYNYYTDRVQSDPEAPILSKYAYGKDYHFVMKDKMHLLFDFIKSMHPEAEGRVFVDSAPVLDRAWAKRAGLGWIGKNSMLISRSAGSFVFIGEIILNLELEYMQVPESDFCGSCTRCIEACPTQAILDTRSIDSERWDVCPWNRKALNHYEPSFNPEGGLLEMSMESWQNLSREEYKLLFPESAVHRAGYNKLKSNLASLQKKQESKESLL
jgi:epoxyqueuosine reductase